MLLVDGLECDFVYICCACGAYLVATAFNSLLVFSKQDGLNYQLSHMGWSTNFFHGLMDDFRWAVLVGVDYIS